ncbi:hypothetical protein [Runella zeae]|uniref:hypothetical protein n=1 Tax=Runella zeae TaxID=94255 RepID=UPI002355DAED|nr:hypothetical protein [Runella zeae]
MNNPQLLELPRNTSLDPISIKLYRREAHLLRDYLLKILLDVYELQGAASTSHLILSEWLCTKFMARSFRIEHGSSKVPKSVIIPLSIARILVMEMTNTPIPAPLNMVLGQIHRQLTNRNFLPQ